MESENKKTRITPIRKKPVNRANVAPNVLLTIVDRGKAAKVSELYMRHGVFFTTVMRGNGTASSEILDILGLEEAEKDILVSVAARSSAIAVMDALNDRLSSADCGKGIACRLTLKAAPNLLVKSLNLTAKKTEERKVEKDEKYSLILISVAQGYADEVMAVAKKAGARGGTLLRAHQVDNEQTEGLFAKNFTPEREILIILSTAEKRNAILESVNDEHGVRKEANAVVLSLAVDDVAKLS